MFGLPGPINTYSPSQAYERKSPNTVRGRDLTDTVPACLINRFEGSPDMVKMRPSLEKMWVKVERNGSFEPEKRGHSKMFSTIQY